jgi:hypothetical protein
MGHRRAQIFGEKICSRHHSDGVTSEVVINFDYLTLVCCFILPSTNVM